MEPDEFKKILESAIESEIDAQEFYTNVADQVEDSFLKNMFNGFVKEEQGHQGVVDPVGQRVGHHRTTKGKAQFLVPEVGIALRVQVRPDDGDDCRKEAAMTKLKSAEVAVKMAEEAMRIHAGAGYLSESIVQRYYRDAILYPITEGTSEIQQLIISRELGL